MPRGEEARKAYEKKDLQGLREAHKKERIEQEPWHDVGRGQRIKDVICAASDGIVCRRNWPRSGLEVLAAGSVAAAVAYLIGYALRTLVG